jgi:ribonuclease P protein component
LAIRYTFKVNERLKREQHINTLFLTGKAFSVFPLRLIYLPVAATGGAADSPAMAGFSVPKKKFSSSVHRHRIRRLMVEAWRHHKHTLYAAIPEGQQLHIFLIFTDRNMPDQQTVLDGVVKGIDKLVKQLSTDLTVLPDAHAEPGAADAAQT